MSFLTGDRVPDSRSAEPAGDVECLAGYKRRVRGCEEDDGRGDVLRLCDAAQRRAGFGFLRKSLSVIPALCVPSVSTMPGLIEFTRMLREPSSSPSERVTASTAAFVALCLHLALQPNAITPAEQKLCRQ